MKSLADKNNEIQVAQKFRLIQELLKIKSVSAFANEIGVDTSVLNNIMSPTGRKGNPSFETLQKIAQKFPRVNIEWLVTGKGEPLRPFGYTHNARETSFEIDETDSTIGDKAHTSYQHSFIKKQPHLLPEYQMSLKVCQAEKENLEKIITLKDEMIEMLKNRS